MDIVYRFTLYLFAYGYALGDSSIFRKVIMPNGFILKGFSSKGLYSEKFLSRKIIILKIFIPKGHYSKDFHPERSLFQDLYPKGSFFPRFLSQRIIISNFRITTLWDKNLRNNNLLEQKPFGMRTFQNYNPLKYRPAPASCDYLLIPIGESHHDVERCQHKCEME